MGSTTSCFIAYVAIALAFFQAPSSIEGFVHLGNTNEPVRGAAVTLERQGIGGGGANLGSGISVDSDENGRFVFKDVAPGTYRLRVAKNGYVTSYHGAVSFFDTGTVLQLVPGQAKKDIVLQLTPSGTLNGVVSDLDDNPIPNTTVQVLQTAFTEFGEQTLQSVGVARTDDRGSFRIYSLTPGSYYVLVGGRPSENGSRPNPVQSGDVPWTFYPNGQDLRFANLVAIASGTESTVRMRVRRQTLLSVAGRLLDSRTQEIVRNARLSLTRLGIPVRLGGSIVTQDEVGFRFVNVEPGEYRVAAFLGSGPGSSPIFSGDVTVNDENLENLVFTSTEPVSVKGHLRIEGVGKPMDLGIQLVPSANGVIGIEGPRPNIALIDKEGHFTVENVLPGDYRVRVLTFDLGYYATSINAGGSDVITKTLHVENAGPGDLEVVLSSRVARIDGVVLDQRKQPVAGAKVVLIPQVGRDRFDLYRQVSANADGRFAFASVAPGTYTLFAVSSLEPDSYFDPVFVGSLAGQSTLVRAGESSTTTVALTLISRISR